MVCEICGNEGACVGRVTKTYGKGKDMFVIDNIPLVTCAHCGESYFEAETLHVIEGMKLQQKSAAYEGIGRKREG